MGVLQTGGVCKKARFSEVCLCCLSAWSFMIQSRRHPAAPSVVRHKVLSGEHTPRISEKGWHKPIFDTSGSHCPAQFQEPSSPESLLQVLLGQWHLLGTSPRRILSLLPMTRIQGHSPAWVSSYSWTLLNNFIWLLSKERNKSCCISVRCQFSVGLQKSDSSDPCCFIPVSVGLWQREIHECKISPQIFTHLWILGTKKQQQHSTDANTRINLFTNLCWYWIGKHL